MSSEEGDEEALGRPNPNQEGFDERWWWGLWDQLHSQMDLGGVGDEGEVGMYGSGEHGMRRRREEPGCR